MTLPDIPGNTDVPQENTENLRTIQETLEKYGNPSLGYPSEKLYGELNERISPVLLRDLLFSPQKSVKPMLFHTPLETPRMYQCIPSQYVPYLQTMIMVRYAKAYSYREAKERLEALDYKVSSQGQIANIFNRCETKLALADKRRSAAKAATERVGKPQIVSDKQRKHLAGARKIAEANRAIEKAKKEMAAAKRKLGKQAAKQGLTSGQLKKTLDSREHAKASNLTSDVPENPDVPEEHKEHREIPKDTKVLYEPTPKQAEFHSAGEKIVLYGGAAGGGKSYGMLVDALRYCMHEDYRGLIIRKTSPMLKELIGVSRTLYPKAYPGAKFNKQESVWYFPSGATIEFGYLDKPEDLERYQGLPYAYIGFDEIQHQRTPEGFEYLMSRLRSANPAITCYMRASANPGGAPWVKEYFIDPSTPGTTFWKNGLSWKFIPAKLEDNKYLDTPEDDGSGLSAYRKMLMALPEAQRKQLLEGDWLAGDDQMFAFTPSVHVTSEDPPLHWNVIRSMDYGYRDPASTLWTSVSPSGVLVVTDEFELLETPAIDWARAVLQKEREDTGGFGPPAPREEVIDWSLFKNTGHTGPGILEQVHSLGMRPKPADRNREAGWNQIHNRLTLQPGLTPDSPGTPTLYIHERCERLIDQISAARIHPKKPEDIDDGRAKSKGRTHHWDLLDCLRYTCMARPSTMSFSDRALKYKSSTMEDTWAKFS